MCRWTKWDGSGRERWYLDHSSHHVFYFRHYISGAGYQKSESNQLILNFKKGINAPESQLYYKNRAIERFAEDILILVKRLKNPCYMTWIPPSKAKNDDLYDDRVKKVVERVCERMKNISPVELVENILTRDSLHGGNLRDPNEIASNWRWISYNLDKYRQAIIVDDVLTTGASFKALHDLIRARGFSGRINGVFWAFVMDDVPFTIDSLEQ
ncbi:MAG: phosphoribosyltransferase [Desulfovibrio sp.]|jgi:hypothetical protein|nr:phosphoribosyltransferase [Desulfovibrio sp.]